MRWPVQEAGPIPRWRKRRGIPSAAPRPRISGPSSSLQTIGTTPSHHLSLDGTPVCGHTAFIVLIDNSHVFILLGPVFPHRAFFVFEFGTFKFSFNPVPALRAGRPVQPAPAVLRAGPQVRIPCGCLPEPLRRREPGEFRRRQAMTATDFHSVTGAGTAYGSAPSSPGYRPDACETPR